MPNSSLKNEQRLMPGDFRDKVRRIYPANVLKPSYTHKDCLEMFDKLSPEEKIKFITEFQNIEIKLNPREILVFKSC